MNGPIVIVQTTFGSENDAEAAAGQLIDARLAACAQISALSSIYRWQGAVQTEKEWRVDLKTTVARKEDLKKALAALHPYEEPEILVIEVNDTSDGYAAWVISETDG